ncbi:hypothetical protein [Aestuariivivens sp. NBU2969]|uniref:hypothetical protein n=1 Tax=Aestuariivivens sp. NBU2969 TaxID=2873267 RepID=UPI001CBDC925|nr:hypothetical protein [Aestuariivivens sp. NBU2969]
MQRLIKYIASNVQGKKVLMLFVITNMVYGFMLVVTIPKTIAYANGMKLLDMMPTGYDYNYVVDLFNTLSVEGRHIYLTNQIPVDMVYPFLFGLTYCLVIGYFLKKLNILKEPFVFLCVLPIIVGVSDYLENFGIITLLNTYPDLSRLEVNLTMIASMLKSVSTSVYFVALIVLLLVLGVKTLKLKIYS